MNFVDSIDKKREHVDNVFDEFLRFLNPASLFSSRLFLKIEIFVMLLRNMQSKQNFCNDFRYVIIKISRTVLKIRILKNDFNDHVRLISRISLITTKNELI